MGNKKKIYRLSDITPIELDSVQRNIDNRLQLAEDNEILKRAETEWESLRGFRERRARASRYVNGDQWGDPILVGGKYITEKQYIQSQGNVPLTNNLIRKTVNSVVGTFVKQQVIPVVTARDRDDQQVGEMMTIALRANWDVNEMTDMLATMFEESVISGMMLARESWGYKLGTKDTFTDICNPACFFYSSAQLDPRHWDMDLVGQFHDITYNELLAKFAKSKEDIALLRLEYQASTNSMYNKEDINSNTYSDFLHPSNSSKYRVFEVWTKEIKPRYLCHDRLLGEYYKIEINQLNDIKAENATRIEEGAISGIESKEIPTIVWQYINDEYWYYRFMTPKGVVLEEGETPYAHGSHPYVIRMHPYVNGESRSLVEDLIDTQRYINRMITLNDLLIRSSAKGVTMVPLDCIPDGMTPETFAEQYVKHNGMIFFNPKNGVMPQQIVKNLTNIGTADMISLQIKLLDEISGVSGAMQGKTPYSGTSAALYAQQADNSTTSLINLLTKFGSFEKDIAAKKIKNIQQFYTDKRVINLSGTSYANVPMYDPEKAKDVEYSLSIDPSIDTPVYRMFANDLLKELWQAGAINIKQLLKHGTFPFADNLLQDIEVMEEQAEQGQIPQQMDPRMMEEINKGGSLSPEALQSLKQSISPQQINRQQ